MPLRGWRVEDGVEASRNVDDGVNRVDGGGHRGRHGGIVQGGELGLGELVRERHGCGRHGVVNANGGGGRSRGHLSSSDQALEGSLEVTGAGNSGDGHGGRGVGEVNVKRSSPNNARGGVASDGLLLVHANGKVRDSIVGEGEGDIGKVVVVLAVVARRSLANFEHREHRGEGGGPGIGERVVRNGYELNVTSVHWAVSPAVGRVANVAAGEGGKGDSPVDAVGVGAVVDDVHGNVTNGRNCLERRL